MLRRECVSEGRKETAQRVEVMVEERDSREVMKGEQGGGSQGAVVDEEERERQRSRARCWWSLAAGLSL